MKSGCLLLALANLTNIQMIKLLLLDVLLMLLIVPLKTARGQKINHLRRRNHDNYT